MAYTPKTWTCGETITDTGLNNIEEGIQEALDCCGGGLPDVTAADNGDVLTVVNGQWNKAEPSCDCELPDVTAADNGDVLTVVNGQWDKAEPSGGDSGYECTSTDTTLTEETVTTTAGMEQALQYSTKITADPLIVTYDGTEYVCPRTMSSGDAYYGDFQSMTAFPFGLLCWGSSTFIKTATGGSHTVKLASRSESVTTTECFKKAVKSVAGGLEHIFDGVADGSLRGNLTTAESTSYSLGKGAVTLGTGTKATGRYALAEGQETVASGMDSHAEGYKATASKAASHAEGGTTTASGSYSHAEGNEATASGDYSHAEGWETKATGIGAHSEGWKTEAPGNYSHAEGYNTKAGNGTQATAHAEGNETIASNEAAHAEGERTTASGYAAHAEGRTTTASGNQSHAEGTMTTASGDYSHSEGERTTASGQRSHAEGYKATASGGTSHAQNYYTQAAGKYQTAIGKFNVPQQGASAGEPEDTDYAFIIGNGTADDARSNALAIKWDGTFVFANGTEITPAQFAALLALLP